MIDVTDIIVYHTQIPCGGPVAEWLCSGLQNRVHRFNSGPGLHRMRGVSYPRPGASRQYASLAVTKWSNKTENKQPKQTARITSQKKNSEQTSAFI
jgi:hypothetical protein